jgi:D-alanyl-D-alanine carboxypeptidase
VAILAVPLLAVVAGSWPNPVGGPAATPGGSAGSSTVAPANVAGSSPAGWAPAGQSPSAPVGSTAPSAVPSGPAPTPTLSPDAALLAALDARIAEWRVQTGTPGVAATIVFKDGSRWNGVAGLADVARGIPVRPGTPFSIASMSKTFTAALVMRLVDEKRLRLDEPAAPRLAGTGITLDARITIAELLDHTSGIGDYLVNPKIEVPWAAAPDQRWTPLQAWAYQTAAVFPPGGGFYYSNANYMLLGLIVEKLTGTSMAANLRQAFFDPLGLRSASYQVVETSPLPVARGYKFLTASPTETPILMPGNGSAVPFTAVITAAGAAGSVAAAATDVATWGRLLYSGDVLPIATVGQMVDDAAHTVALASRLPYGYGVHVVTVDGQPTYGHTGRYLGARGAFRWFPLEGLSIAVLTNQSRADPSDLLADLVGLVLAAPAG